MTNKIALRKEHRKLHKIVSNCQCNHLVVICATTTFNAVMVLARFFVFVSLIYLINAASINIPQGYLVMDTTAPASCHDMPSNQLCPSFSHPTVGENSNPQALVKIGLQSVKLQLAVATFFRSDPACVNSLREYSCSNSLMNCTKSNSTQFGFVLNYDVNRTQKACAKVQSLCSQLVQDATIHKCSVIQTDPFEFAVCNYHTFFKGDICPRTNYMVTYKNSTVQPCFS